MGGQANTDAGLVSFGGTAQVTAVSSQIVPVAPTGIISTGQVGSVTVIGDANVYPTGIFATGEASRTTVWGKIIPDANTIWTEIAA